MPRGRGPLSSWVIDHLTGLATAPPRVEPVDAFDDDLQLALYLSYEPHFSQLPGVLDDLEWDPLRIDFRRRLEAAFEVGLRRAVGVLPTGPVREVVPAMIAADDGPSLSMHMERCGTLAEFRRLVVHRSAYQLKEADGHTFGIPHLNGTAKQLLARIQAGEYGADADGHVMHAALYATTMRELGLDARLHAYLDVLPGTALAISNVISMFGLHRRWRGALIGHLAVFEMTSVEAMGRYGRALERLGGSPQARRFYDVHVLADAEHEVQALDMIDAFASAEPDRATDVIFGAACALAVERPYAAILLAPPIGVDVEAT